MKHKKTFIFIILLMLLTLVSCTGNGSNNGDEPGNVQDVYYLVKFETNTDEKIDSVKVLKGEVIVSPNNPIKDGYTFIGWYKDVELTELYDFNEPVIRNMTLHAKYERIIGPMHTVTFVTNSSSVIENVEVEENFTLGKPIDPSKEGHRFVGWYTDELLNNLYDFNTLVTSDFTLYAKYEEIEYEEVHYVYRADEHETEKLKEDKTYNRFTLHNGTNIRTRTKVWSNPDDSSESIEFTKSIQMESTTRLSVNVVGKGKLVLYVQNGSSGADYQQIVLTSPDNVTTEHEYVGNVASSPIVRLEIDVTEGIWTITRGQGTTDIFMMELKLTVEVSEEVGFEIADPGITDYVPGEELNLSELQINSIYKSGITKPLDISQVTIDSSNYQANVPGIYEIKVSYKNYSVKTFEVYVFDISRIELGFNKISLTTNTGFGNGVYYNNHVKQIYNIGEYIDTSSLSVMVYATYEGKTKSFIAKTGVTVLDVDTSTPGTKEVTVVYTYGESLTVTATFDITVINATPSIVEDVYQVKVDASYTGVLGEIVDGYNMFNTINQALDFLVLTEAPQISKKHLVIAEGTYNEKVEIEIPNLTITGAGSDKTIIEWDSLYGLEDESGYIHTTDSTATVAVREKASRVIIENLTISNFWNSLERFDENLGPKYGEHRALALLVQADKFIMRNSTLLGYQDTVEFFTGRQYIENVLIKGTTDFIFGTNNTTYFTNCTIHSISNGSTNGGYITAFKGSNKGDNDYVVYGAIFDGCIFTADEDVLEAGNTAIARPWAKYSAVAIINSTLGSHISLKGSTGASRNERYVSMNALPTDETVKYFEYNNTGLGALTEEVAGMHLLTLEEAAKYSDISIIFGKTNGKVSWLEAWDPNQTEIEIDERTYYYFDGTVSETGTSYTLDKSLSISGVEYEFGSSIISSVDGKVAYNANANALNMKSGAYITFDVEANTLVVVNSYPGYQHYTINGVATVNDSTFSQFFEEATTVVIKSIGDAYLFSIVVSPNEEKPQDAALEEIKASGLELNYTVGDEISLESLVVNAIYSNGAIYTLSHNELTIDTSSVNITEAGSYDITITYQELVITLTVVFENPNSDPAITSYTKLSFESEDGYNAVLNNPRVIMSGNFRKNGAEYQIAGTISFLVKAGTLITVNPYANTSYASYTIGKSGEELPILHTTGTYIAKEDCEIVYSGLENNYLVSIEILPPVINESYKFGASVQDEATYDATEGSIGNILINGTLRNNGDSMQVSQNQSISLMVQKYATVTVKTHTKSYGQFEFIVNGEILSTESDANGVYTFTVDNNSQVIINPLNVGTEESPQYNKSYIKLISVSTPLMFKESIKIAFGSAGNYKDVANLDLSHIAVRDNGGNNSQINNGYFDLYIPSGTELVINGYSGYTSYTLSDGESTTEEITDTQYIYTSTKDVIVRITPVSNNNYFYSVEIKLPVVIEKEDFTISFGSQGNYKEVNAAVDLSNIQITDNGGNNSQVKNGYITVILKEGATLTINGYPGYTSYTLNDGTTTTEEITQETYSYIAATDVTVTITAVSGNNYFYSFAVAYPKEVLKENANITFGSQGNYKEGNAAFDFANIQISDNGGNNSQVKNGYITIILQAGGTLTINGYPGYTSYTLGDGTTTTEEITSEQYTYTATEDVTITITPVSGNNYFYSMSITY